MRSGLLEMIAFNLSIIEQITLQCSIFLKGDNLWSCFGNDLYCRSFVLWIWCSFLFAQFLFNFRITITAYVRINSDISWALFHQLSVLFREQEFQGCLEIASAFNNLNDIGLSLHFLSGFFYASHLPCFSAVTAFSFLDALWYTIESVLIDI